LNSYSQPPLDTMPPPCTFSDSWTATLVTHRHRSAQIRLFHTILRSQSLTSDSKTLAVNPLRDTPAVTRSDRVANEKHPTSSRPSATRYTSQKHASAPEAAGALPPAPPAQGAARSNMCVTRLRHLKRRRCRGRRRLFLRLAAPSALVAPVAQVPRPRPPRTSPARLRRVAALADRTLACRLPAGNPHARTTSGAILRFAPAVPSGRRSAHRCVPAAMVLAVSRGSSSASLPSHPVPLPRD